MQSKWEEKIFNWRNWKLKIHNSNFRNEYKSKPKKLNSWKWLHEYYKQKIVLHIQGWSSNKIYIAIKQEVHKFDT